jgi:hypothetical protein
MQLGHKTGDFGMMLHNSMLIGAPVPAAISNIVVFPRPMRDADRALLAAWVAAGRRMGLHDAAIVDATPDGVAAPAMVVIWVRENPDPAYLVRFEGVGWTVVDQVRGTVLGRFGGFAEALTFIRPVLPVAAEVSSDSCR